MLTAAVVTAGVTFLAMLVVMVITVNIGVVAQTSVEQCAHRSVSVTADTAVELDTRLGQSCLRTAADASADQSVYAVLHQEEMCIRDRPYTHPSSSARQLSGRRQSISMRFPS